jgi:hypothetical protein
MISVSPKTTRPLRRLLTATGTDGTRYFALALTYDCTLPMMPLVLPSSHG